MESDFRRSTKPNAETAATTQYETKGRFDPTTANGLRNSVIKPLRALSDCISLNN